jgi:hypothetical protein
MRDSREVTGALKLQSLLRSTAAERYVVGGILHTQMAESGTYIKEEESVILCCQV